MKRKPGVAPDQVRDRLQRRLSAAVGVAED